MNFRPTRILGFMLLVAVALSACGGGNTLAADRCFVDTDCRSGFCDGSRCAEPEGNFGAQCLISARSADDYRDARIETCGAYLCIDQRCRSCTSDAQCQSELGAPRCKARSGHPGQRCGR